MSIFNYRIPPFMVRELDSDTRIDLTHEELLRQERYEIFNITENSIRIFMDGGAGIGIEYLCKDNDATTDDNYVCDFILPPYSSKAFKLNKYGTALQIKD